jgi:hypothetical protein
MFIASVRELCFPLWRGAEVPPMAPLHNPKQARAGHDNAPKSCVGLVDGDDW